MNLVGERVGNYHLLRLLGEGGMGQVYEATHVTLGGRAAVKVLHSNIASHADVVSRFLQEARAANAISHPGIVKMFDSGYSANGFAFLAMEFLEGESLRARLERNGSLPPLDTSRIGRQIALALQAAHQKNIIHRDLKPDNIMIVPDEEATDGERVKILDFGIAKMGEGLGKSPNRTRSDMMMGTPAYMAPEQCRAAKLATDRSDVYSFGVILYQMLAGRPPFNAESFGELIAQHLADAEPQLRDLVPHVSSLLADLVHSMLNKTANARPSMEVVARKLADFSTGKLAGSSEATLPEAMPTEYIDAKRIESLHQPAQRQSSWPANNPVAHDQRTAISALPLTAPLPRQRAKPVSRKRSRLWLVSSVLFVVLAVLIGGTLILRQVVSDKSSSGNNRKAAGDDPATQRGRAGANRTQEPGLDPLRNALSVDATAGTDSTLPGAKSEKLKISSGIAKASQAFRQRHFAEALQAALAIIDEHPVEGWWLVGMSACNQRDLSYANRAVAKLNSLKDDDHKIAAGTTSASVEQIYTECQAAGLVKKADGQIDRPDEGEVKVAVEKLKGARILYDRGQYQKAREQTRSLTTYLHDEAWELIGLCDCGLDDLPGAELAFEELRNNKAFQLRLVEVCRDVHDVKRRRGAFTIK